MSATIKKQIEFNIKQLNKSLNIAERYLNQEEYQNYCDNLYACIVYQKTIAKKIIIKDNSFNSDEIILTSLNPSKLTDKMKDWLKENFVYFVIDDTIRFNVTTMYVKINSKKELAIIVPINIKTFISELYAENYKYLEF